MPASLPILENVRVATPCTASWEDMKGDEKTRFCGQCKLNVHNFSAMTEQEIVRLVTDSKGRICGRLFRRADGTMITKDCPVGLRALRRKVARVCRNVGAAVLSAFGLAAGLRSSAVGGGPAPAQAAVPVTTQAALTAGTAITSVTEVEPIKSLCEWIAPAPTTTMWMGDIVVAPPPAGQGAGP
jgi:hypothetical protein